MLTFALDPNDSRVHVDDAQSRLDYFCPTCGAPLIARRGEVRRHHFAHRGEHACTDSWDRTYEDSEWHFQWEERFPKANREITLDLGGTRHRADVMTGWTVVEFQHSPLTSDQFNDRNTFYADLGYKVVWLYDLREYWRDGKIVQLDTPPSVRTLSFGWSDPRVAFSAYDITFGNVDLFFQLRDDDGGDCIVHVCGRSDTGFESFEARRWLTTDAFLWYVGLRGGTCTPPNMTPLEPNDRYLSFKDRYGIKLNPQQERAAQTIDGATLLLAVPGSGKTTTLVARLGYMVLERGIPPESVIAVTYTNSAAKDMRRRFATRFGNNALANRIRFCTINSLSYHICEEWYRRQGRRMPRMLEEPDKNGLLRRLIRDATDKFPSEADRIGLETGISYAKNNMLSDDAIKGIDESYEHFDEMYHAYQDYLAEHGLMDYDDQMSMAFHALSQDPDLLAWYRGSYRYWSVDEAQDTSRLQHNLIYKLVGSGGNIFMVGDEDQSIYAFRGAHPKSMLNFKFVYRNAVVLKMERNYRSGRQIVSAANSFIRRNKGRFDKNMTADRDVEGSIRFVEVPDRLAQHDAAYDLIRSNQGELAILYRDNDVAVPLLDRFLREDVPFTMLKGKKTYFTASQVRDICAFFRLALNPYDSKSFKRIYSKASCYLRRADAEWACKKARRGGPTILDALVSQMSKYRPKKRVGIDTENAESFRSLIEAIAQKPPLDAIDFLMNGGYGDYLSEHHLPTGKVELLRPIAAREQSLQSFLDRLAYLNECFDKPSSHRRTKRLVLSSVHSCKGMEFERVLVLDAIDGVFPSQAPNPFDRSKDNVNTYMEERRLFYVAITRAKDELILTRAADRDTSFVDEVYGRLHPAPSTMSSASSSTSTSPPRCDHQGWEQVKEKVLFGIPSYQDAFQRSQVLMDNGSRLVVEIPRDGKDIYEMLVQPDTHQMIVSLVTKVMGARNVEFRLAAREPGSLAWDELLRKELFG